jgi:hypothetical protein
MQMKLNEKEEKTVRFRSILEGSASFGEAVQRLIEEEAMGEGKAITIAARHSQKLYNKWCRAGRPDISVER